MTSGPERDSVDEHVVGKSSGNGRRLVDYLSSVVSGHIACGAAFFCRNFLGGMKTFGEMGMSDRSVHLVDPSIESFIGSCS